MRSDDHTSLSPPPGPACTCGVDTAVIIGVVVAVAIVIPIVIILTVLITSLVCMKYRHTSESCMEVLGESRLRKSFG